MGEEVLSGYGCASAEVSLQEMEDWRGQEDSLLGRVISNLPARENEVSLHLRPREVVTVHLVWQRWW